MATTANPHAQAWLANEAVLLSPYLLRLGCDCTSVGALDRGHCVVVPDAAGALKNIGRILRIRSALRSTTLYFDRLHTVRTAGSLADVGVIGSA